MSDPIYTSPIVPTLRSNFDNLKGEIFNGMNCHEVGEIVSFNASVQTASVQIKVLRVLGGTQVPYPVLTDCPVFVPSGGAASLRLPVKAGDPCLVLFNDRDLDIWFTTGNTAAPNTSRAHSLSDGMVLVGFHNMANKLTGYATNKAQLAYGSNSVTIQEDGSVILLGATGAVVRIDSAGKISIFNGSETLATLMDNLFTVLAAWINTGGTTPNPATVLAINALKLRFTTLLST